MGTLDIILLVCFIPSIVQGIWKGLVRQAVALVSIFLGAYLAWKFSQPVGEWLSRYMTLDAKLLNVISFTLIVTVVVIALNLTGLLFTKVLDMASLGWLNRLLGFVFSIFKTALILGLVIFVFDSFNEKWSMVKPEVLQNSVVYTFLHDFSLRFFPFLKSLITQNNG